MIVECPGCTRRYDLSGRPKGTRARCRCGTVFELPDPPDTAKGLQCPSCAATVPATATKCEYCSAQLAVRACPRCFGMLFDGHRFCPHCGAKTDEPAEAVAESGATPRFCPRCDGGGQTRLEARSLDNQLLDTCPGCAGIFVDGDLLERMLAERRYRDPPQSGSEQSAGNPHQKPVNIMSYIRCPDCDRQMLRRNYARRSGVVVDICQAHGIWFDARELEQLIAFVQSGGLDPDKTGLPMDAATPGMQTTLHGNAKERERHQVKYDTSGWNEPVRESTILDALISILTYRIE